MSEGGPLHCGKRGRSFMRTDPLGQLTTIGFHSSTSTDTLWEVGEPTAQGGNSHINLPATKCHKCQPQADRHERLLHFSSHCFDLSKTFQKKDNNP